MTASAETVLLHLSDGVATITLNRPDELNSLDLPTKTALRDIVLDVSRDPSVRCVVLTGTGRAFCVGQDLKEHLALLGGEDRDHLSRTVVEHYNPTVEALATMAKPVIAGLNGVAAGAGASLALACDLRVLASSAGLNLAFAGVGLSCDSGASWTLPRLVGPARALDLLYRPRTLDAEDCLARGLATAVVPDADLAGAVRELAVELAAGPTVALGAIRQAVRFSAGHGLAESLTRESELMALTGATRDHEAGVAAFVSKQRPVFEGH